MDINVLEFYRIFAFIGLIIIIYQVVFLCNKQHSVTYFSLPFWLCFFVWVIETTPLFLSDMFGKPDGLDDINSQSIIFILYILLLTQVTLTVLLYLFSGQYAEFHIIYTSKKRNKAATINLEESYIVLYGFSKLNKKKIYLQDISIENSVYVIQSLKSKFFPHAAVIGSKEYFSVKLKNGEVINIINKHGILSGAIRELITLTKVLGIKYVS